MKARNKGILLSYALLLFEALYTLLIIPICAKAFGQGNYGVYNIAFTLTAYIMLLDMGMGNAVVKFMAQYNNTNEIEKQKNFFAVSLVYYFIIAFISVLISLLLIYFANRIYQGSLSFVEISLLKKLLFITMINTFLMLIGNVYLNILVAFEKFVFIKSISIIFIILRIIATIICVKYGGKAVAVTVINAIATGVRLLLCALYVFFKLKLKPKWVGVDKKFVKLIFIYISIILLQMVATQLNKLVDSLLLSFMVENSAPIVAVYTVGSTLAYYLSSFASGINGVMMPSMVKLVTNHENPQTIQAEMVKISRMVFIVVGLIFAIFLVNGQAFISFWVGNEYKMAYYVAIILMLPLVFSLSEMVGTQILWAMDKAKILAYLQIFVAIMNIGITVILIKWKPIIGAAIGTAIALFVGDLFARLVVYKKQIKINSLQYLYQFIKGILLCLIISIGCGYSFNYLVNAIGIPIIWEFVASCIIMLIVFMLTMILFGFNKYEKDLIRSKLKKFSRK